MYITCTRMVCICVISSLYHRRMSLHEIVISPCSVYMYFYFQYGETALMMASSGGHVECVKLLLKKSASADLYKVSAVSHQVLSIWHAPLGIVEVNNVY